MPSADSDRLDSSQRHRLLRLARQSIEHGLEKGRPVAVDLSDYPTALTEEGAAFVTLHTRGALRGCIGHLEAIQPLVQDVAENAFAAAFRDPRFPPLVHAELAYLVIEISVLSPSQPLSFASEEELLRIIEPGRDGLILEDGAARGTFLPTVWESLPEPRDFLRHLKQKAGLRPDHWSHQIRVRRYRTESFSE
ncbi:MAG: AmmeMemoRadiSam system protein A [Chromatiaceae bacterium]|nr:AmmeMemoRadiSam system protein A [Chromatiaceae bacterium]